MIARLQNMDTSVTSRITGSQGAEVGGGGGSGNAGPTSSKYRGAQGLDEDIVKRIEKMYGFDKPIHVRFILMLKNYIMFDFGESYFRSGSVIQIVISKLPVSISLGVWSTLIIYLISIPLGIRKAVSHGSRFDIWSSTVISVGYAIPAFLFAILLIILFCGGQLLGLVPATGPYVGQLGPCFPGAVKSWIISGIWPFRSPP